MEQHDKSDELRRRAQEFLEKKREEPELPTEDFYELLDELKTHQIELEIQNEDLRESQEELTSLHREYTDLYEFAPCGYLSLSGEGVITLINLNGALILGENRAPLTSMRLSSFVAPEGKDAYYEALNAAARTGEKRSLELLLRRGEEEGRWVQADIRANVSEEGGVQGWLITLLDVHERVKSRDALRESEAKFRTIFHHSNDAILIHDLEGRFLEVNDTTCERLGYGKEELEGMSIEDIDSPDQSAKFSERLELLRKRGSLSFEAAHVDKGGTTFPVEVNSGLIVYEGRLCVLSIARDITERKQVEEERERALNQLLTIFENLEVGVLVISRENREILFANSYIKNFFDIEPTGRSCTEVFGYSSEFCDHCPNFSPSSSEAEQVYTLEYPIPDLGKWFLAHIRPLKWRQETDATIKLLTDITSIKEAEQLRDEVDRIARHDLKSPLNGMLGVAQLMAEDEGLSPTYKEYANMIEESGRNILSLIDGSLSIYWMERGTYEPELEEVATETLIERIKREYASILKYREIDFEIHRVDASAPPPETYAISGEYLLCYSLFSNLIKNAVEASKKGGTVRVSLQRSSADRIEVSIWNRKPLPERIRKHFGKKYSTTGKKRGTGLGLYSAILMTEVQGGTLHWSSSEEEGTTITVSLPAADTER